MKYLEVKWRPSYHSKIDAETALEELEAIREEMGCVEPEEIVKRAKPKESPIHPEIYRETDKQAVHEWRLLRARNMTNAVVVVREAAPNVEYRAYEVKKAPLPDKPKRKVYTTVEEVLEDPIARDEMLARAFRELASFRRKFAALQELALVFHAIDETLSKVNVS